MTALAGSRRNPSAELLLLMSTLLWGLNPPIIKLGLGEISPLVFPVIRFAAAGLVLLVLLKPREGSIGMAPRDMALVAATAFVGVTINQACFVYALANTAASDVAFLFATGPLVTALLATAVGIERLDRHHWLAAMAGLVGVSLIIGGRVGAGVGASSLLGAGLALLSVVTSSASALPIRYLLVRYTAWRIMAWELTLGSLMLLPFALPSFAAQDWAGVTLPAWIAVAYAVGPTGIVTNVLYFTAMGQVGPSRAAMYGYLQSLLSVVFAVILLGERVLPLQVAGGLIVIGSVMFSRAVRARPSERVLRQGDPFGAPPFEVVRGWANRLRGNRPGPPAG